METNEAELRSIRRKRRSPADCDCSGVAAGRLAECWSIGVMGGVDSRQTTLHYSPHSITPARLGCRSVCAAITSPAAQAKIWEEFSGEKALAHVQRLVDLGPHPRWLGRNRKSQGLHRGRNFGIRAGR